MSVGLLKQEALRLAPEERAQLIDALWDSLAGPERAAVDAAWAAESERRIDAFEKAGMVAEDGPEMSVAQLVSSAQHLPAGQRKELCEQLAGSLDAPLSVEETAWIEAAERRALEMRTGSVAGVAAEDALAKARQRLGL